MISLLFYIHFITHRRHHRTPALVPVLFLHSGSLQLCSQLDQDKFIQPVFVYLISLLYKMADCRVYRFLCIGDSRLRFLQYSLNNNQRNMKFNCYVFPGATLGFLAYQLRLILTQSDNQHYDYIVVVAGLCDITTLERSSSTRVAKPTYPSISATVENFERLFSLFRLTVGLYTQIPIIYSTIAGMHLGKYANTNSADLYYLQPIIDNTIPLINIIIKRVNGWNGVPGLCNTSPER